MASTPESASGRTVLKRILVGRAVSSANLEHTLLPKILALPVFSSDALSSVAYATEEILGVLLLYDRLKGARFLFPIAVAIASLMTIVVLSYRQTVKAYPNGGGAYIVSKENLGTMAGLIAAAALLTDYILTVSVSVAAGVFAMYSAAPRLAPYRVELSLMFIVLITLANLRGVKEAGAIFAIPVYAFIVSIFVLIAVGLTRCIGGCPAAATLPLRADLVKTLGGIGLFAILRAFSSGATALTGVEAISNGVPAFRRPQAKNASDTLAIMGAISVAMFLGISFLASRMHVTVSGGRSVLGQIAHTAFGGGIGFFLVQILTTAILVLAANTSFQDFPRLASLLARDRFMPRQFANRGDRLVFSNGVIILSAFAALLVVIFRADVNRLIQLYVVGVFTSFTLSQTGMVRHWHKEGKKGSEAAKGWRTSIVINGVGAVATALVLVVVTATKFKYGAYIVIIAIPIIVATFASIHRHYMAVQEQLRRGTVRPNMVGANHVVLVANGVSPATGEALGYVRSLRPTSFHVVYPGAGGAIAAQVQDTWRGFAGGGVDLESLPTSGDLFHRVRAFIRGLERGPNDFVTVVVPETVDGGIVRYILKGRQMVRLKSGLLREPNVVVTDVPVRQGSGVAGKPLIPSRTVTLVFLSQVNDASIRAINYAESLAATETRAIYFDMDPETAHALEEQWFDRQMGVPLDIVEAPFRDLTTPMLAEVRRFTERPDTVVNVVVPEFILTRWRHLLLHNQSALFIKRLFLFEERAVLTSVPFLLASTEAEDPVAGPRASGTGLS
jgi:amino acid transporter